LLRFYQLFSERVVLAVLLSGLFERETAV